MFSGVDGEISSKRVSGFAGWITIIGICIYCTINKCEAPALTETLTICSSALLGIESATTALTSFGGRNKKQNNINDLINNNYGQ